MKITPDIEIVYRFGLKHNWPAMVLKRSNNIITKIMGKGKTAWRNTAVLAHLNEPYKRNFTDLLQSVERNDIWQDVG